MSARASKAARSSVGTATGCSRSTSSNDRPVRAAAGLLLLLRHQENRSERGVARHGERLHEPVLPLPGLHGCVGAMGTRAAG